MRRVLAAVPILVLSLAAPLPAQRGEPAALRAHAATDHRLSGAWEVWLDPVGGRHSDPEPLGLLRIHRDGSYRWEGRSGRLRAAYRSPGDDGGRWYLAVHPDFGSFELAFDEWDEVLVLHGRRGESATGYPAGRGRWDRDRDRWDPDGDRDRWDRDRDRDRDHDFGLRGLRPGSRVQAQWGARWWDATVLEVGRGQVKVRYDGWSEMWDEWLGPDRVRRR